MRYTVKDAERAFERLLVAMGKHKAASYKDVGGWRMDYNTVYGGVQVEEIVNEGGGVDTPFGLSRMSAKEFVQAVRFLVMADRIRSTAKN